MDPRPYGPFAYMPINRRPKITWPNGARVALWVIPNIEFFALDEPQQGSKQIPNVPAWAKRDYGNRIGVFRMMEVMSRYDVRGTVALNSDLCDWHPEILDQGAKLGWEFMGHNQSNTRRLTDIPAAEEGAVIAATLDRIEKQTGKRPRGWLGSGLQETWNSLEHLAAAGVQYVADWVNDDQPYRMDAGGKTMISVPYSLELNDKPAFEQYLRTPEEFTAMITRAFDVLYREGAESGRVMAIALHPYLTGVSHRIDALDAALAYICKHSQVWRATGEEIMDHYVKTVPAESR